MLQSDVYTKLIQEAQADGIQQLVVGTVIQDHGRVLFLKRPTTDFMGGIWELPSGKVEQSETLDQAIRREVVEETGLTITGISSYLGTFDYQSASGKRSRQYNFEVDVDRLEPIRLTEHDAYVWAATADDLPVTEAVKEVLGKWAKGRTE